MPKRPCIECAPTTPVRLAQRLVDCELPLGHVNLTAHLLFGRLPRLLDPDTAADETVVVGLCPVIGHSPARRNGSGLVPLSAIEEAKAPWHNLRQGLPTPLR